MRACVRACVRSFLDSYLYVGEYTLHLLTCRANLRCLFVRTRTYCLYGHVHIVCTDTYILFVRTRTYCLYGHVHIVHVVPIINT